MFAAIYAEGYRFAARNLVPAALKEDAEKMIRFLQAAWHTATTKTDKDEFHRLANEIRKAAGIPIE